MDKLQRLTAEDRDNLVAYLDGELDEEHTRRVEAVLAQSNVARTDVELLARTYELLDQLEPPKASVEFAEKTVATAKLDNVKPSLEQQRWYQLLRKFGPLALWPVATLVAGIVGFAVTRQGIPQQDDLLLEQYPVIKNLDTYSEVGSYEFLEQLSRDRELLQSLQQETHHDAR
jgi:anti-sigma factor RsiW